MYTEQTGKVFLIRLFIVLAGMQLFLFAYGCSNPVAHIPEFMKSDSAGAGPPRVPSGAVNQSHYRLVPYDGISITFPRHPEYNSASPGSPGLSPGFGPTDQSTNAASARAGSTIVRPDGNITLEGIGSIRAAGLTPDELAKAIAEKYSDRMKDPEVVVTIVQFAPRKVYVGGEVKTPGVVFITEGVRMTPMQAIFDRGGFTETAQNDSVVLIRDGGSGDPKIGRLNVNQSLENAVAEQVTLQPNDVLYVPMSGIGRADLWVKQHLREILPMELLGLGTMAR
ncbi:MAG TPA: polysaccharide biosynthesis/export family protein [Candidatus Binatia bacterium]|nr:polysaccharide biosynthesis/export family protein [Candidatus Binatia bacterium]